METRKFLREGTRRLKNLNFVPVCYVLLVYCPYCLKVNIWLSFAPFEYSKLRVPEDPSDAFITLLRFIPIFHM